MYLLVYGIGTDLVSTYPVITGTIIGSFPVPRLSSTCLDPLTMVVFRSAVAVVPRLSPEFPMPPILVVLLPSPLHQIHRYTGSVYVSNIG